MRYQEFALQEQRNLSWLASPAVRNKVREVARGIPQNITVEGHTHRQLVVSEMSRMRHWLDQWQSKNPDPTLRDLLEFFVTINYGVSGAAEIGKLAGDADLSEPVPANVQSELNNPEMLLLDVLQTAAANNPQVWGNVAAGHTQTSAPRSQVDPQRGGELELNPQQRSALSRVLTAAVRSDSQLGDVLEPGDVTELEDIIRELRRL